jgi:type IV fimbrial biogenesis protein FimT
MILVRTSGFSLIELMIGLAIAALLMVLALPSYSVWVADAQVSNAAESIAGGLRLAQGEALKRNSSVEFVLDPTTGTGGWIARAECSDLGAIPGAVIQTATFREGASRVAVVATPAVNTVTFNSLGQIMVPTDRRCDGSALAAASFSSVAITSAVAGAKTLRVLAGGGRTGVKICDPKWPATDPKGCP